MNKNLFEKEMKIKKNVFQLRRLHLIWKKEHSQNGRQSGTLVLMDFYADFLFTIYYLSV